VIRGANPGMPSPPARLYPESVGGRVVYGPNRGIGCWTPTSSISSYPA
jgi:hypothetical protein